MGTKQQGTADLVGRRPEWLLSCRSLDVIVLPGDHEATKEFASWVSRQLGLLPEQLLFTPTSSPVLDEGISSGKTLLPGLLSSCISWLLQPQAGRGRQSRAELLSLLHAEHVPHAVVSARSGG